MFQLSAIRNHRNGIEINHYLRRLISAGMEIVLAASFRQGCAARTISPLPAIYHFNMALFPRPSAVITHDYCHAGHLPCINKAEERWQQVATLTPTARLDIEESRFRPVRATIGGWPVRAPNACSVRVCARTHARTRSVAERERRPSFGIYDDPSTKEPGERMEEERRGERRYPSRSPLFSPGRRSIPDLIMTPRYIPPPLTIYYHYYLSRISLRPNHLAIRHGW